jgi:predicted phage tail protein
MKPAENVLDSGKVFGLSTTRTHRGNDGLATITGTLDLVVGAMAWGQKINGFDMTGFSIMLFIMGTCMWLKYTPIIMVRPSEYSDGERHDIQKKP